MAELTSELQFAWSNHDEAQHRHQGLGRSTYCSPIMMPLRRVLFADAVVALTNSRMSWTIS